MVYQSELGKSIQLDYVGKVKYIGNSFGVDGLTDGTIYTIVKDNYGVLKVVDDSEEDYIYNLKNPRPADGSSKGGKFLIVEDDFKILDNMINRRV